MAQVSIRGLVKKMTIPEEKKVVTIIVDSPKGKCSLVLFDNQWINPSTGERYSDLIEVTKVFGGAGNRPKIEMF